MNTSTPASATKSPVPFPAEKTLRLQMDLYTELTLLDREHAPEFLALIDRGRPYLRQWLGWLDTTKTLADVGKFIDSTLTDFSKHRAIAFWIWHRKKIVGIIHLRNIDRANLRADIGYWVGEEYRGKGFAKRATKTVCDYAFRDLKLNRIQICCATENAASQAVPTSLGFKREGELRENEWLYDRFVDHAAFAMLAKDWKF